ncbi:capsular polysaccharide export protein, LipB/KpsS family [Salinimonas chungwhensis]|uniref:capsular polysaccharide export protein, LipB/KpsS family n=1 Tax=Salinimonas chungwhensis TaxID=265425 RepID=UPI000380EE2B|nr:hypothetical protein [Salinimonas chungwhensis]
MRKQHKKFVFIARGSSHINYFKAFADASSLNVTVIKLNRELFRPGFLRYLNITQNADIETLLHPHLIKKSRKHPKLYKSFLWPVFKRISHFLTKLEVVKSAALIDEANADVVGVWNGQKLPSSAIAEAAKILGKEIVYFENGLLPHTTTCDWSGVNCLNSLPRIGEFYLQFYDQKPLPQELVARKPVRDKAEGLSSDSLPKRYIFVPFQVETDSQIISNSPWIRNMRQLYWHISNVLEQVNDPHLYVVIKEHPSEPVRHDNLHHQNKRILFANQCNTQKLIEQACAVMTINSTVGLEALLLGKPVIVLGKACYGIEGVSKQVKSEEQMIEVFNHPDQPCADPKIKCGFLNFMHDHYTIPSSWKNIDHKHVDALTKRLLQKDTLSDSLRRQKLQAKN